MTAEAKTQPRTKPRIRDAEATKARILKAALSEFTETAWAVPASM